MDNANSDDVAPIISIDEKDLVLAHAFYTLSESQLPEKEIRNYFSGVYV
jgi:hypothetical protein